MEQLSGKFNIFQQKKAWIQYTILTLLMGFLLTIPLLFGRELESGDETRVAGIAAEIFYSGNWLLPKLNGTPFLEYPPLFYWCISGCFSLFGVNDFAARMPSVLFSIGILLLVMNTARALRMPAWSGFAAAVLLAFSAQFIGNSRKCMVDIALAFFMLLSISAWLSGYRNHNPKRVLWFALSALGVSGGMLTKGLLGFALPAAVLGSTLIFEDVCWNHKITFRKYWMLAGIFLLGLVLPALYYLSFLFDPSDTNLKALHELLVVNNFGRFSGSQGDHVESFFYYFEKLPMLFFPWLPLLLLSLFDLLRKKPKRSAIVLLCFQLVPFALFCAASSKRVVYLLPLMSGSALLCAYYLAWPKGTLKDFFRRWGRKKLCFFTEKLNFRNVVLTTLIAVAVFDAANILTDHFFPEESVKPLFARCKELEKEGWVVEVIGYAERTRGAAYFYLGHPVKVLPKLSDQPVMQPTARILRKRNEIENATLFADSHWLKLEKPINK